MRFNLFLLLFSVAFVESCNSPTNNTFKIIDCTTEEFNNNNSYKFTPFWEGTMELKNWKRESYPDSYVYAEIGYIGCRGCAYQHPYYNKLIENTKNPNVKFISIHRNITREQFIQYHEKYPLDIDHYLLNSEQSHKLKTNFDIQFSPLYILISPAGDIVYGDAPRPDSERIFDLLNRL